MTPILANTITGDMGLIPGLAFVGPAMGLPLSVMASVVERPFYSRAGVGLKAIWFSLQANLISLLIGLTAALGFACVADAFAAFDAPFIVWPFLAVAVSVLVERRHLVRRTGDRTLSWAWVAAGNVVSAGLCVVILLSLRPLRERWPDLPRVLRPWQGPLYVVAFVGSAAAFVAAFYFGPADVAGPPDIARD